MNPAHVGAEKSIKNAVANKAFLHSKKSITTPKKGGLDGDPKRVFV